MLAYATWRRWLAPKRRRWTSIPTWRYDICETICTLRSAAKKWPACDGSPNCAWNADSRRKSPSAPSMIFSHMVARTDNDDLLAKAVAGERLTPTEGLQLLESRDLAALGRAADEITRRLHPETYRTYNIDRNINYTNVCAAVCHFCAFYRTPRSPEGYVLDREVLLQKVQETVALGGDQILMQGGLHPEFKLEWYEELLHDIKSRFPQVNIHGFSPPEIYHFTKVSKLPLRTVLERLQAAGLGSLPGGGAEILVDRVRRV